MSTNERDRIVLFHPKTGHEKNYMFFWIPYSILSLAAPLHRHGWKLTLTDSNLFEKSNYTGGLENCLNECFCIGISSMIGHQIKDGLEFAKKVREIDPQIPIVWGGPMASVIPEIAIRHPLVDIVVRGQGEITFQELLAVMKGGGSLRNILGISYKENGKVKHNPDRPLCNKNLFPPYPFDLIDLSKYVRKDPAVGTRTLNYVSSQGCPYSCGFCSEVSINKKQWTGLGAYRVINEIEYLIKKCHLNGIKFYDSDFTVNLQRVGNFCSLMLVSGLKIRWAASANVREILRMDEKTLELIAKSGCSRLLIGAESGVQEELDLMKKMIKVEDNEKVAWILRKHGIVASFTLMVGFPGSPSEYAEKTLRFGEKLKEIHPQCEVKIHFYAPYPGTPLWPIAIQNGFDPPKTLEEWSLYDYYRIETPWIEKKWGKIVREFNLKNCPYILESNEERF